MLYVEEFINELTSRKCISSLNRHSKLCTHCGEKNNRFANICFDEPMIKSEVYLKQMSIKHKDFLYDIKNMKTRFYSVKIFESADLILENSKINNFSKIDISKCKNYKRRKEKRNDKNTVFFEMFCAECLSVIYRCVFHREKFIESFYRKLK